MAYAPDISKTVTLSTGRPIHLYFDHANHTGLSPEEHKLAADWHDRQAKGTKNQDIAKFHSAQRDLHTLASTGKSTKIRHIPSQETIARLPTNNKQFWIEKAVTDKQNNQRLMALEPYRLSKVVSNDVLGTEETDHVQGAFHAVKKSEQDTDLMRQILDSRRAARHGEVGETASSSVDPRTQISTEQLDAIREAVSRRNRGGW